MRWIKTRASVSLQRDSARRPSAVRRRREARVEGERSELATTRRRQSVRRAAITRSSNLRRAALGRGKKAQRSGASGKPACKSCRRGVKRTQVQAQMGWRRATRDKLWRRRQAVGSSRLGHGKLGRGVEGSRGRSSWGRGETGASCHKREEGRVEGSWRMLDRKKHPWTERNEHQNGKSTRTVNRPLREPFWVRQARPIPRHAGVKLHESRTGTGITAAAGSSAVAVTAGALCSQQWTDRWN